MIFPEIAFLWNVREGFEPSPPAMLPALINKNRTYYGQLLPITPPHTTHRLFGSVRKAKWIGGELNSTLSAFLQAPSVLQTLDHYQT